MSGYVAGALTGLPVGALASTVVIAAVARLRAPADPVLTDEEREQIAVHFRTHAEAMQQQVSQYADAVANGDLVLRERLRAFEAPVIGWTEVER